jgi:hypothetical protein
MELIGYEGLIQAVITFSLVLYRIDSIPRLELLILFFILIDCLPFSDD